MIYVGSAFLAYASASLAWSGSPALPAAANLATFVVAFVLGWSMRRVLPWQVFAGFVCANILVGMYESTIPWGLFGNPNYLGCAIVMVLAASAVYPWQLSWTWPFIPFGLLHTESRTAFIGAAMVLFCATWRWRKTAAIVFSVGLIGATFAIDKGPGSLLNRLGIWQDTLNHLTVFGHGFGSFATAYAEFPVKINMTFLLAPAAYNDALQLIFELGIGAVFAWFLILLALTVPCRERLIVWAYLAMSMTYFPLYVPAVGQALAFTLGTIARKESLHEHESSPALAPA